ncbi:MULTISPECIES: class I SAM-dependent methyltransferase [unclassified Caballeronia]|uniref:class I SAM-dependent methyltransferase n=1 Tax=unclassified Caballeronia TaxID=2646786 RepID=UPI00285E7497|nr:MULTISPECIES: class I SAM-dependent methyltransferase [unclassified Caballeronia]MDR5750188.1 class I SAM-dependent methyltransferase [Caballeronia sp. LZ024]MDR5842684.1 class I SAM-dependent methyltransferase [Caballeronia sp. LZ031]
MEHGADFASAWVRQWAHLVEAGGAVLDVAAGSGRHARWFASRGHPVLAVDRDAEALGSLSGIERIATRAADLENAPWPLSADEKFAAVVVTRYLHRPLFPHLADALAEGGILIYETFARGNETVGKPSNPAFLLAPGELVDAFHSRLRIIAFQDGFTSDPRASYVQRICAVREPDRSSTGLTVRNTASLPPRYDLAG